MGNIMIHEILKRLWDEERKNNHKLNKIINKSKKNVLNKVKSKKPVIFNNYHYGAIGVNPKNLVIWYIFKKDIELELANENGLKIEIEKLTIAELEANGYPESALDEIYIAFTTDEDIQKVAGGNYYYYFK
jgi:hypothetical protein